MTCMGLVHNGAGLIAARFFLGLAEAGLFPGVSYIMSCWYKRSELGVRIAIFFSAAALAGSFGGLLAAAIADMSGVGGKDGWAWIFILEGLFTVMIGFAAFWLVPDFPEDATFLTESERRQIIHRLALDHQVDKEPEKFQWLYFGQVMRDWKTYTICSIFMGVNCALYSFALFVPTIINEMVSNLHPMSEVNVNIEQGNL
jgi:MFS family permease